MTMHTHNTTQPQTGYHRFWIVNETDVPCERLIAQLIMRKQDENPCPGGIPDGWLEYIHPDMVNRKRMPITSLSTPVIDFGLDCHVKDIEEDKWLIGTFIGLSRAQFSNGNNRPWQGRFGFTVNLTPPMARIWSFEHNAWWGVDRAGYTTEIDDAGVYSMEVATEIATQANQHSSNYPREAVVPCRKRRIEL